MSFKEFLNHKRFCPICSSKLDIKLSSTRGYKIRYEDNSYVFSTVMTSINKSGNLHIDIVIDGDTDDFYVNFYDRSLKKMSEYIPISFINSFKEFDKNQKEYLFERKCPNCYQYGYSSHNFNLDFKSAKINLVIARENICYYKKEDDTFTRVFKVTSYKGKNDEEPTSIIFYKDVNTNHLDKMFPYTGLHIEYDNKIHYDGELPLFSELEDNINKIETLLTFS